MTVNSRVGQLSQARAQTMDLVLQLVALALLLAVTLWVDGASPD